MLGLQSVSQDTVNNVTHPCQLKPTTRTIKHFFCHIPPTEAIDFIEPLNQWLTFSIITGLLTELTVNTMKF